MTLALDAIGRDPEPRPDAPAVTTNVAFRSDGDRIHGVLYAPAGDVPHPLVVLLHGFPGWERNGDIAQALRRAGFGVLVFHYRGCWGMPGAWSWANTLADTEAVLDAVLGSGRLGDVPIDTTRIAVAGHSLGGFLALKAAATRPAIRVVASIAGFDFGAVAGRLRAEPSQRPRYVAAFEAETEVLTGTSGEALTAELERFGDGWSLRALAPAYAGRHVLLVGTGRDPVTPADLHHRPLVERFAGEPGVGLDHVEFRTDHALSDHRVALTHRLAAVLSAQL